MADATLKELSYGNPGSAVYDIDSREWSFTRQPNKQRLKQIWLRQGIETSRSRPATAPVGFASRPTPAYVPSFGKHFRQLARKIPQLSTSSGLIGESSVLSAAIHKTALTYDPHVGNLLSFGFITTEDRYRGRPRRIAALPVGEAGSVLKLAFVNDEQLSWGSDKSVRVEGSTLKDAECAYWNDNAAPIQQICFAQTEDPKPLLAVRLPSRTVCFRPRHLRRPQAGRPSPYYDLPPSTIDACPLFTVTVEETGGSGHADVTFNPEYQLQFAIVDQSSRWSIWDIDHRQKRDTYAVSCIMRGPIVAEESIGPGEDGWARILWVGDVNTIVVCNRRHLSMINVKIDSFERLPCPNLFSKRSTDWIVDVKPHPKRRDLFFLLTTTHFLLMSVRTSAQALDTNAAEAGVHLLFSWRHFRGVDDITLQSSLHKISEDEIWIVLHSRLNPLVQIYILKNDTSDPRGISVSDPQLLAIQLDSPCQISQISIEAMRLEQSYREAICSGPGALCMERGILFHRVFVMLSDLSVQECVIHTLDSSLDVEDFSHSHVNCLRLRGSHGDTVAEEDGDFIVPDGLAMSAHPRSKLKSQIPRNFGVQQNFLLNAGRDYSVLYAALRSDHTTETLDFASIVTRLEQLRLDHHDSRLLLSTLTEAVAEDVQVSDVDDASDQLENFLMFDGSALVRLEPLASPHTLDLIEETAPTLSALYDTILEKWIASLPPHVPARVRQHRERLARRIAAEVLLSSHRMVQLEDAEQAPVIEAEKSQEHHHTIPILPSVPGEGAEDASNLWSNLHSLPTPPHSSIPSSLPPSSPPPTPTRTGTANDPRSRLGRWLQLRDDPAIPVTISPNVSQALSHWQIGADPHLYDWDSNERALISQDLDENSQQQREKERRRKERRERRQQRENELMLAQTASQQSVIFPRSSPGPMVRGMDSSSQVQSQGQSQSQVSIPGFGAPEILLPQSQVEPGRFGGRPDKKKKKKGRVSGF